MPRLTIAWDCYQIAALPTVGSLPILRQLPPLPVRAQRSLRSPSTAELPTPFAPPPHRLEQLLPPVLLQRCQHVGRRQAPGPWVPRSSSWSRPPSISRASWLLQVSS